MATRTTHRQDFRGRSEYSGETRENTILAKAPEAELTAWEKLRLTYLTGTQDVTAEPDPRVWLGYESTPNSVIDFED